MSYSNLYFRPLRSDEAMAVRDVRGTHLGNLITVRGIVTRVSEVKPLLQVNAYTCDVCGSETFQDISRKTFMPIVDCQNASECLANGIHGSLHMQTRACRFSPFQEIKIQEMVSSSGQISSVVLAQSIAGRPSSRRTYPSIHDCPR
jgi:DNA replication licensing factor MCM7